ncbi:MAG: hypothetical protein QW646_07375 [Ignisphaera sp.]
MSTMRVCGGDPSGWVFKAGMRGFPHGCEPEPYEGELWVEVSPKGWRPMTWAPMKRCSEDCEAKGRYQTASNNMKPEPLVFTVNVL